MILFDDDDVSLDYPHHLSGFHFTALFSDRKAVGEVQDDDLHTNE